MKSQSSFEKMLIVSAVVVISIILLFFIYKEVIQIQTNQNINYITSINFGNIYSGNNIMFATSKNNISIGTNAIAYLNVKFINGTTETTNIEYKLQSSYMTKNDEHIYEFATTKFNLNSSKVAYLNISIAMVKTNRTSLEPNYKYNNQVIYYPANSLTSLNTYLLNITASPINGGTVSPQTQYYYSGDKVLLSATPNNKYGFVGWYGYGDGNYSGLNETQIITINGNITEIARFAPIIPIHFNETFSLPYQVNFTNYVGNNTINLVDSLAYKYTFPLNYENKTTNAKYFLNSVSGCGINSPSGTIIITYGDINCTVFANYSEYVPVFIFQKSLNNYGGSGTVYPSSGYYQVGKSINLNAVPNQNSEFFEWVGSGLGNYTGSNQTQPLIIRGPTNETAIFGIKVPVYILSNIAGSNITVGLTTYKTNITSNLILGNTYKLIVKNNQLLNWGTRLSFMNWTGTTCKLNSNGTVTINISSCKIQANFEKQYLLLIMEQLGNGSPQNTTQYGSLSPGNYTWEPVGANVIIGGYSDVQGYSFVSFYGKSGSITYSGVDSYPYEEYPYSASASSSGGGGQQYSCSESTTGPTIDGMGNCGGGGGYGSTEPHIIVASASKTAEVTMDSPIVEIAEYNKTNNYIMPGCYPVSINYVYENYTFSSSGNWSYYTNYENPNIVYSGTINTNICISNIVDNWTPGLGSYTMYYFTTSGTDSVQWTESSSGYWSYSNSYSGATSETLKNTNYMSNSFNNAVQNTFNNALTNLKNDYHLNGQLWYSASFNFANDTFYYYQPLASSTGGGYYNGNSGGSSWGGYEADGPGFTST